MGSYVSHQRASPLEKKLRTEGKTSRSSTPGFFPPTRVLTTGEQQAVFKACQDLLSSRNQSREQDKGSEWIDEDFLVSQENIEEVVGKCWVEIDRQCQEYYRPKGLTETPRNNSSTHWQVVRLFVSSTFSDFYSERECLVKKVFPELREWCESRRLQLIECDLRWGVPQDTATQTTISTCLEELDRCHDDTGGEPFFIGMLGERYGWIPRKEDISVDISRQYEWVAHTSITHMEILHAAFRPASHNAAFFLRDPAFLEDIPPEQKSAFIEQKPLGSIQLRELKKRLRQRFPDQVFDYHCRMATEEEESSSQVNLKGYDDFCQQVLDFFKSAIARKYSPSTEDSTPSNQELEYHNLYMVQRGQLVFGRDREIDTLLRYARGENHGLKTIRPRAEGTQANSSLAPRDASPSGDAGTAGAVTVEMKQQMTAAQDNGSMASGQTNSDSSDGASSNPEDGGGGDNSTDGDSFFGRGDCGEGGHVPPLVFVGSPGTGKSSVMARCAMKASQMGLNVFYHFVGCSPDSIEQHSLVHRLCRHLLPPDDGRLEMITSEYQLQKLVGFLTEILDSYVQEKRQVLLVIDAVNQLSSDRTPDHLMWLPEAFGGQVRCIVSSTEEGSSLALLRQRKAALPYQLCIGDLTSASRIDIVQNFFNRYNKRLDPQQLVSLVQSEGGENALWLSLACEELRVFGVFEKLTEKIRLLPSSLDGLMSSIIGRLVEEDDTECLDKALCFLECSRLGLTETELQMLLGDTEARTAAPMMTWARVRRTLKHFLRNSRQPGQQQSLSFFHSALNKAVRQMFLEVGLGKGDGDTKRYFHLKLAEYYQDVCQNDWTVALELPHQLKAANLIQQLHHFLTKDRRALAISSYLKYSYIKDHRCLNTVVRTSNFKIKIFFCQFCKLLINSAFGILNKDACIMCGRRVSSSNMTEKREAYICGRHGSVPPPNFQRCWACEKIVSPQPNKTAPGYVCAFCDFPPSSCCKILA